MPHFPGSLVVVGQSRPFLGGAEISRGGLSEAEPLDNLRAALVSLGRQSLGCVCRSCDPVKAVAQWLGLDGGLRGTRYFYSHQLSC